MYVHICDYFSGRWDREKEIEDQFVNYQSLMDYMNNEENEMKIRVSPHAHPTVICLYNVIQGMCACR